MHWLGPYRIEYITYAREFKLSNLNGEEWEGLVNGSKLKIYKDSCVVQ